MFYKLVLGIVNLPFRLLFPFETKGIENLPEGRVVIAGNHSSNTDSVMVLLSLPWDQKTNIIGKTELFQTKFTNWFFRKMGAFPVNRGSIDLKAIKNCIATLKAEKRLLIFPEGTRVQEESVEAKNGAANFAMRTNTPVLPVYITKGKHLFKKSKVIFGEPYYIEGSVKNTEDVSNGAIEMMNKIYSLGE